MNILIVDDYPETKVRQAIQYLEQKKVDFTYTIVKSYNSAAKYIAKHIKEVDLAIVDLGLPWFDGDIVKDNLEGIHVVSLIAYKSKGNVPVIINSTTAIPDEEEYLKQYTDEGANIQHVKTLYGEWLYEFINNL